MDFNGFVAADFDFFKKKDKFTKEEYDKFRNEVKLHFRKFCYELQKIYHKNTDGVLELDKEFHGFSKKSEEIAAYNLIKDDMRIKFFLNSENVGICLEIKDDNLKDFLTKYKDVIKQFLFSNKHAFIELQNLGKGDKKTRILALDYSEKNYEGFIMESNKSKTLLVGFIYNKNEAIKLGKDITKHIHENYYEISKIKDLMLQNN
ncbi:hypothetical protein Q3V94_00580 [Caloramator sp. CAR-1]|uniref:hypothetical protein n=1 Tax=Caloramator sp. CAR-1 TaxID=3062777 RepID=UPI0026E3CB8E|nr:hypothetical protein [Caloramator sp. CAR-1]MDO6353579.1 hypothetical protein [Caloramator sp. CAR-1]